MSDCLLWLVRTHLIDALLCPPEITGCPASTYSEIPLGGIRICYTCKPRHRLTWWYLITGTIGGSYPEYISDMSPTSFSSGHAVANHRLRADMQYQLSNVGNLHLAILELWGLRCSLAQWGFRDILCPFSFLLRNFRFPASNFKNWIFVSRSIYHLGLLIIGLFSVAVDTNRIIPDNPGTLDCQCNKKVKNPS